MKNWIKHSKEKLVEELWAAEPKIKGILKNSKHVEESRFIMFDYLNRLERDLFNMRSDTYFFNLNIIEKRNAKECIRVFSNVMRTENESLTGASPLELLFDLAKETDRSLDTINEAFLCEFISLFRGITGKSGKHTTGHEVFSMKDGREAAILRSEQLDDYAGLIRRNFFPLHSTSPALRSASRRSSRLPPTGRMRPTGLPCSVMRRLCPLLTCRIYSLKRALRSRIPTVVSIVITPYVTTL